jgi:hypothetical protein
MKDTKETSDRQMRKVGNINGKKITRNIEKE